MNWHRIIQYHDAKKGRNAPLLIHKENRELYLAHGYLSINLSIYLSIYLSLYPGAWEDQRRRPGDKPRIIPEERGDIYHPGEKGPLRAIYPAR